MGDSDTSRLETFSDGVIAIAITLLVLDVHVPHARHGASFARELGRQWPSYAGYVVSFLTVGIMWINHHRMFKLIGRVNHTFLMLNVVFLMTIAAVPFTTALVAEHIRDSDTRTLAAVLYGGLMVAVAIMFNLVWRYAARGRRLLDPAADATAIEQINRSYVLGPIAYGTATLLALVNPWISLALYASLAVFYMLPGTSPRSEELLAETAPPAGADAAGQPVQPGPPASQPPGSPVVPDETN
ncbi:MAG: TMEM175 family protein [Actinomycetota bacterium]|nr:TMEM175 family protein [Actinomycetota bacterium]